MIRAYILTLRSRIHSGRFLPLALAWHVLRLKKLFRVDFKVYPDAADREIEIDLVIPTISKDVALLEEMIAGAKKNILHRIRRVFIVSRDDNVLPAFCEKHGYSFVEERSVMGYGKERTAYKVNGVDRSGWMFQQILKLSSESFVGTKNYLIIDSDTVLIKPHSFIENGKFIFAQNEEWHEPYFRTFKKLFGYEAPTSLSYTSHMMIFNTDKLRMMKAELERRNGSSWDAVYMSTASESEMSCISDYDTYANWVLHNFPDEVGNRAFYNKGLSRDRFSSLEQLTSKYGRRYNSLSFHSYIKVS
ncbi:MAG: DUF6492 family protein [Candidatus Paceibacterota bacterium]|jgi:hypothetical protein